MTGQRPDANALLQAVSASSLASDGRGRLKVFFGANAGVGKTYAMLQAALARQAGGTHVLAGVVETHGRSETAHLLEGLEQLPSSLIEYRGVTLSELDLDAALERRPDLLLVDELAHTNAPGSRHAKRWQDVEELLAGGIDIYTTLNVQHVESLNDVVAQITGIVVRETVPDSLLERADEIELVDISPDDLLQRLHDGKVYIGPQAQRALESFFTRANLTALRELALRRTAQQVDAQLLAQRTLAHAQATWPAAERLIVCIGPSPHSADVIRAARRLASDMHASWEAVYVDCPGARSLSPVAEARLAENMRLAESLGASAVTLNGDRIAETLVSYARQQNANRILIGKPAHPQWQDLLRGSLVSALIRLSGDIDVYVVRGLPAAGEPASRPPLAFAQPRSPWTEYALAVAVIGAATALALPLHPYLQPANLIMLYLLALVGIALRAGRGPAVLATVLAVAVFDFCLVEPRLTFAVGDVEYLLTFAVMLTVGLTIVGLAARLKQQVQAALAREQRSTSLYHFSRELAAQRGIEQIAACGARWATELLHCPCAVLLRGSEGQLSSPPPELFANPQRECAVAQWTLDNGRPAGSGTATLPGGAARFEPLAAGSGTLGVLAAIAPQGIRFATPSVRHLLETLAALIALALERELLEAAQAAAELVTERERLRSTLLAGISHDLRTPLAGIRGSAETLLSLISDTAPAEQRQLLSGIQTEAERLNLLLSNILDMTRLEAGVELRREPVGLDELAAAALASLEARLSGRNVQLDFPQDLPLVNADAVLIERVLVNLLDNALKYSPDGSPLDMRAHAAPDGMVECSVADRGQGLPSDDPQSLFAPFSRASTSAGGSGLGLAICRAIITAHGGTIGAFPRPGGGSIFSFTLPREV